MALLKGNESDDLTLKYLLQNTNRNLAEEIEKLKEEITAIKEKIAAMEERDSNE